MCSWHDAKAGYVPTTCRFGLFLLTVILPSYRAIISIKMTKKTAESMRLYKLTASLRFDCTVETIYSRSLQATCSCTPSGFPQATCWSGNRDLQVTCLSPAGHLQVGTWRGPEGFLFESKPSYRRKIFCFVTLGTASGQGRYFVCPIKWLVLLI